MFTLFELANFRTVLSKPVIQQSTPVMEQRCSWYSAVAFSNLQQFNISVSILKNQAGFLGFFVNKLDFEDYFTPTLKKLISPSAKEKD